MTLDKSDLQKFFKRLRKIEHETGHDEISGVSTSLHKPRSPWSYTIRKDGGLSCRILSPRSPWTWKYKFRSRIRYYAVGEYGSETLRPHFHIIAFNVPAADWFESAWSLRGRPIGLIDIGKVSGNSIAYCAKYMDKGSIIPVHPRDDRLPKFSVMSQGIGSSYLTPGVIDYHRSRPDDLYLVNPGGHKIAIPKFYRDRIWNEEERRKLFYVIAKAMDAKRDEDELAAARIGLTYEKAHAARLEHLDRKFKRQRNKIRNAN